MTWSLNEVEALCRKAARGAGYGWGHAEDAGRAVRWLCGHGYDGIAALARYFEQSHGDLACPIRIGAALSDLPPATKTVDFGTLAEPLLLLPFVADVALVTKTPWTLHSPTGWVCLGPDGRATAEGVISGALRLVQQDQSGAPILVTGRATVTDRAAQVLQRFAARTYAPATEQSRLAGAGAGVSDND